MLQKLNTVSNPTIFTEYSSKNITNTIVDAVDSVSTSITTYGHAHSSALRDDYDAVNFISDSSITLDATSKYCCGVFLSNPAFLAHALVSVTGSFKYFADTVNGGILPYFIFGRSSASTVTQSDVATANQLSSYCIIQPSSSKQGLYVNIATTGVYYSEGVKNDFMVLSSTNTNPLFFGLVLENLTATASNIKYLLASLQIRSGSKYFPVIDPGGQ